MCNQNTIYIWTKGCLLSFPKGDLRIDKNLRGITLTSIAPRSTLLENSKPKIKKILWKNQNGFRRNRSTSQILTICRILEGGRTKNLDTTILFVDFSRGFDSIHRGKMEQIFLTYGSSKKKKKQTSQP